MADMAAMSKTNPVIGSEIECPNCKRYKKKL